MEVFLCRALLRALKQCAGSYLLLIQVLCFSLHFFCWSKIFDEAKEDREYADRDPLACGLYYHSHGGLRIEYEEVTKQSISYPSQIRRAPRLLVFFLPSSDLDLKAFPSFLKKTSFRNHQQLRWSRSVSSTDAIECFFLSRSPFPESAPSVILSPHPPLPSPLLLPQARRPRPPQSQTRTPSPSPPLVPRKQPPTQPPPRPADDRPPRAAPRAR